MDPWSEARWELPPSDGGVWMDSCSGWRSHSDTNVRN